MSTDNEQQTTKMAQRNMFNVHYVKWTLNTENG